MNTFLIIIFLRHLKWCSLSLSCSQLMYANFLSLSKFLLCVRDEAGPQRLSPSPPFSHTSRVSKAREVDASEWMRLQYSDAVREDFLGRGEYIDSEQPWINLAHSAAMSGRHPDFEFRLSFLQRNAYLFFSFFFKSFRW